MDMSREQYQKFYLVDGEHCIILGLFFFAVVKMIRNRTHLSLIPGSLSLFFLMNQSPKADKERRHPLKKKIRIATSCCTFQNRGTH
jgi:hypothetical protein